MYSLKAIVKRGLRPLTRSWLTARSTLASLKRLGVRDGGVLLVHSSLSELGYVPGGSMAVIRALRSSVGRQGTLVLPTHTWQWMNQGCRVFDAAKLPSCVGAISESFRAIPEAIRSLHPTHSVAACGPLAAELIEGHELATTPCGRGTPYARILDADGQVLLLGVGLESNTVYHTVEALSEVDYLLEDSPRLYTIADRFGQRRDLSVSCHCNGVARRFGAIEPLLVQQGILRVQRFGAGRAMLFNGLAFRDFMAECLQRDPAFLLA